MKFTIGGRVLAGRHFEVDIEMYDNVSYGLISIHNDDDFYESYTWYFHEETLDERLNDIEITDFEILLNGNID